MQEPLARYPMADDQDGPSVYTVDVTFWPSEASDAEASPKRGYYYHPSRHSAGQPIVAGWTYQMVAQIDFSRDTWVASVDVRRVHPTEDENYTAAKQVRALLERMPHRSADPSSAPPLFQALEVLAHALAAKARENFSLSRGLRPSLESLELLKTPRTPSSGTR